MGSVRFVTVLFVGLVAGCADPGGGAAPSGPAARARAVASEDAVCTGIGPFYWAIGDVNGTIVDGSVGSNAPTADTRMLIASASKWIYGAYVVEHRTGTLTAADVEALTFRSGYTNFDACGLSATVGACATNGTNGDLSPENVGKFFYNGGHMQKHAVDLGLGAMNGPALATEVMGALGADVVLSYPTPQLAGGVSTSAADYARFLRHVIAGDLGIRAMLGSPSVCTNPTTCADAVSTPIPTTEDWHYGIGHWIEDDPAVGDGAVSSPGLFGFYPWIDASTTVWGIVARYELPTANSAPSLESVVCGRSIRRAFFAED